MLNAHNSLPRVPDREHDWALVLAGGEGKRLQQLTRTDGGPVPKQFCSLAGGPSLLQEAMHRAQTVVCAKRTCAVVTARHRAWWGSQLESLPRENVVVQAEALGTAMGILGSLLMILRRDPQANLLVLPSDHFVKDEAPLTAAMSRALTLSREGAGQLILLGIAPDEADSEFGYVVPTAAPAAALRGVSEFIEKPDGVAARAAIARGAVWNSFIFAVRGRVLLDLFAQVAPDLVAELTTSTLSADAVAARLDQAPHMDFSSDVLQRCADRLRVLTVPACGWSDLGTPRRLACVLRDRECRARARAVNRPTPFVNLAHQLQLHHGRAAL